MRNMMPAMLVGILAIAGCASTTSGQASGSTSSSTTPAATVEDSPADVVDTPAPTYTPVPEDFTLGVKIREKECFGSAGCNVTYRIDPSYSGEPIGDETWDVTYEVRGGEDGPVINTFTIDGDSASVDSEETVSTTSSKKKLTAKVTDVSPS